MVLRDVSSISKMCRFSTKQIIVAFISGVVMVCLIVFIVRGRIDVTHLQDAELDIEILQDAEHNDEDSQESGVCRETFNETLQDNLMVIKHYPVGVANDYMWKLDGNISTAISSFPVIVTAFDWQYYPQSMGLFESIHKRLMSYWTYGGKVKVIFYDLGLTERQLRVMRLKCRCEIRTFPFDEFPPHVKKLKTYAFKPIIIQMLLLEFGFVWWVDTSVRFQTGRLDEAIQYTKKNSVLFFVIENTDNINTIPRLTDRQMFEFLGEDVCKFREFSETMATTVAFHYDEVSRTLVRAWAVCALNENCIAPEGSENKRICDFTGTRDGECHRFDQSVLSILTRRICHKRNMYPEDGSLKNVFSVNRAQIKHYFESCLPILKCLA